MLTDSPWGAVQEQREIGPGITLVETASHGGIYVEPRLNQQIDRRWRRPDGWYEEDCDWAIVALTFGRHFITREVDSAHKCAARWHTAVHAALFPGRAARLADARS